jgi:hypothetical protein
MNYTIEATGLDGWMAYRYQYKAGVHDFFGYAETEAEALATIKKAQDEAEIDCGCSRRFVCFTHSKVSA